MKQLRYIWRTYRELIIATVMCLVGFCGLLFGVLPTAKQTLTTLDEIKTLSAAVAALSQKAATLDALSEDTLREELAVLVSAIPTEKAVPSVFGAVDRVADDTGVEVTDMSITQAGSLSTASAQRLSSEEKTLGASLLPFSVTIRSSMDQLRTFIGRIASVRRLSRVRNFDVSVVSPGVVQSRLALDAFYVPLPTSLAKADAPLVKFSKEQEEVLGKLASFPWFSQPQVVLPKGPAFGNRQNPFAR